MIIFFIILIGFGFLLMLSISLKDGALSPLFLFMAFTAVGVLVRAFQLVSEAGSELVLAPWVLGRELESSVFISLIELFVALTIIFSVAYIIRLNNGVGVEEVKVPDLLKAHVLTRRQSIFLVIIGVGSIALFFGVMSYLQGGLFDMVLVFQSRSVPALSGRGYAGLFADIPVVVTLFLAFNCFRRKVQNFKYKGKWEFYGMLILTLVMLVVMGGRGALLQFLLMIGIIYYACKQWRVKISWSLFLVLLISFVVVVAGLASRHSAQNQKPLVESISTVSENLSATLSAPFALLDHYMLLKVYVDNRGFDYGMQYISYLVRPIPRSVWADKPVPLALKIRQMFWGDMEGGIPPTVFGEFFVAFGYFGVFLGCIILGAALGFLGRLFRASFNDPAQSVLYALIAVTVVFSVVRTGVEITFVKILIYMAVAMGLNLIFKLRIRRVSEKPQCLY